MSRAARTLRQQRLRRRWRSSPASAQLLAGAAGVVGTQLGLLAAARARRWFGPVLVAARADLASRGGTHVDLSPAGTAVIRSHLGPLRVTIAACDIDPARAAGMSIDGSDTRRLLDEAAVDAKALGRQLAVRTAAAGVGGGALAGALLNRRGRDAAVGAATGAATGAALVTGAAAIAAVTVNRDAWRDPQLQGLLTKAPLILGDLRTAPERIDTYRAQLAELVRTGTDVYQRVLTLPAAPPDDAIRLLHISDIHLSPAAFPLVEALLETYRIDAVVDTGDLVDWGTPPEQTFAAQIGKLDVPYVFVKGNHDSAGIAQAVAEQPNATVLDAGTQPVEVAGLRFAGMADPRFTPDKTSGDDYAEHRVSEDAKQFAERLGDAAVDVLVVHDPAAARALAGIAPLLLAGHTHRRAARRVGATIVLVQGTSGGSGLRGVQQHPPTPIALSVVYLDRETKQVWGVDEVTLGGIGSVRLNVERKTIEQLLDRTAGAAT